eukprot:gene9013-1112_t
MKISVVSNSNSEELRLVHLKKFTTSTYKTSEEIYSIIEQNDSDLLVFQVNCLESNEILEKFNEVFGKIKENVWMNILMTFKNEIDVPHKKFEFEQSFMRKNGKLIENLSQKKIGIHCSYFGDLTRVDSNEIFDIKSIVENNGNGTLLVDHLLIELSFRLDFKAKYGA